ncbi:MAG: response regulator [Pedosphaera sp.]|nr:response regulator [Pedosphaera sp.]
METGPRAPRKHNVLLVDDNLQLAETLRQLLEAHGFDATVVSNGVLALKHILHKPVDVVVCDLRMPQLEGDMFYSTVERVNPELAKRFVFITGMAEDPHFEKFVMTVKAPVLRKPVPIETLLAAVKGLLPKQD